MRTITLDPSWDDTTRDAALAPAAEALRAGALVAFATETVYGLGANGLDPAAVARIFEAKGRPATNPLILHVPDVEAARALSSSWPAQADRLAEAFWPGPLTMVVPRAAHIPDAVTASLPSVAVRVPQKPSALALLRLAGVPVAAPSANRYTRTSPSRAEHVREGLSDRGVAYLIDDGPTRVGLESTVLSLAMRPPTILRPGMVTLDQLRAHLPDVVHHDDAPLDESAPLPSPGLARRHYAPRARVIHGHTTAADTLAIAQAMRAEHPTTARIACLTRDPSLPADDTSLHRDDDGHLISLRTADTPAALATHLYDALHTADALGAHAIVIQAVPATDAWRALADRLARTTG